MYNHVMDSKGRHVQGCKASLPSDEAPERVREHVKKSMISDCRRIPESNLIMRWRLDFRLEVCLPATVIKVYFQ